MNTQHKSIAVIGSTGMLGYAVSEYYKRVGMTVLEISRKEFDIAAEPIEKLENIIENVQIVINCAGVIKPRINAMSIEDVLKINSLFPRNLAKLCNRLDKKCFHITTDCVFTGRKGHYSEDDYFDAEDIYGLSKAGGDSADCMVLRTSIIGEEKGQCRSLLEWARSQAGKEVNGFTNHLWNGVTTLYLAQIINKILKKDLYKKGLFHIHSLEPVNKYKLLNIFNDVYKLNLKINAHEGPSFCDRSMSSIYDLAKKVCDKSIKEQVEEMKLFFEESEAN